MFDVGCSTKAIGDITEAVVMGALPQAGFSVLVPWGENQRYDLVVETGGHFLRVQCKTGRVIQDGSILAFSTASHDGHRARQSYRGQADLFAVYAPPPSTGQVYVLPVEDVGENAVWLRLTPARNGQEIGVRYAEEYLLSVWAARQITQHPGAGDHKAPDLA